MVDAIVGGLEHAEELIGSLGLLSAEHDSMLFATVDDIFCFPGGQADHMLPMLLHFLDSLLALVDHFVNLNKPMHTGM
jgi:hypothetical protein